MSEGEDSAREEWLQQHRLRELNKRLIRRSDSRPKPEVKIHGLDTDK